jgi:hypothetical protein
MNKDEELNMLRQELAWVYGELFAMQPYIRSAEELRERMHKWFMRTTYTPLNGPKGKTLYEVYKEIWEKELADTILKKENEKETE